jgi:hypothetical protein
VYEELPSGSSVVRTSGVRRDVNLTHGGDENDNDDDDGDILADYEEMPPDRGNSRVVLASSGSRRDVTLHEAESDDADATPHRSSVSSVAGAKRSPLYELTRQTSV